MPFNLSYAEILARIDDIDPVNYSKTRNYLDGAVTHLSPFISRGVISGKQVLYAILEQGHKPHQIEKFIQELAWREYFQRIWQAQGDLIWTDLKQPQPNTRHHELPAAVSKATTDIEAIDNGIRELYKTGYMHNHMRMYLASVTCNIGGAHWKEPARWLYYHLLDGDIASNNCSWQWVAGAFSSKKYYCNQENINKYTHSAQRNSFLDKSYDDISFIPVPHSLTETISPHYTTILPPANSLTMDPNKPTLVYNSYNLDPIWRKDLDANRILLLEPTHFQEYPVSPGVMSFILQMAFNIPGLQVYVGEFQDLLNQYIRNPEQERMLISKEHPAFRHYSGTRDARDWLFPSVTGYFLSFFSYWKKCERLLKTLPRH